MAGILDAYKGRTVLAVGAHPDDVEIGMGGTIARLTRAGVRVVMTAVTVPDKLYERIEEAHAAADILGAESEILEPERCRRVEDLPTYELVGRLDRLVRKHEPAAMFAHSAREIHYDHVLVHRSVLSSMRIRPMDLFFYGPSTCKPTLQSWHPRVWVDVSDTIEDKVKSISAHRSQFGRRGICVNVFREQAHARGLAVGFDYAEGLDVYCARG